MYLINHLSIYFKLLCMALVSLFLLNSCAILPTDPCVKQDWFLTGNQDGSNGVWHLQNRLEKCKEYSAEYGTAYQQGYVKGLNNYCAAEKAKYLGQAGDDLMQLDICPPSQRMLLQNQYQQGLQTYCSKRSGFTFGRRAAPTSLHNCPKHLKANFTQGYQQGLAEYCTAEGFNLGKQGTGIDFNTCSDKLKRVYLNDYARGLTVRQADIANQLVDSQDELKFFEYEVLLLPEEDGEIEEYRQQRVHLRNRLERLTYQITQHKSNHVNQNDNLAHVSHEIKYNQLQEQQTNVQGKINQLTYKIDADERQRTNTRNEMRYKLERLKDRINSLKQQQRTLQQLQTEVQAELR